MKSRKLISLLCAAALTTSTFAGLATTASAADSVLYSNNFNGYTKDIPIAVAYSAQAGWADLASQGREPFASYVNLNVPTSAIVENAEEGDNAITIACGTSNDDDTTGVYIKEKAEGDNYVSIPKGRFGKQGNTVVHFGEEVTDESGTKSYTYFAANEGEDLVVAYDMMLTLNGTDRPDQTIVLNFGDVGSYSYVAEDEAVWKKVRVISKADGTKAVYIDGTQVLAGTDAQTLNSMTVVMPSAGDKAGNGKYPLINLDEMVVMSVAAGTAETVEVPAAKTSGDVVIETLPPAAEKVSAPTLAAPEGLTPAFADDFSAYSKSTLLSMTTEAQEPNTTVDGMSLKIGNRTDGGDGSGASVTEWVSGDNVLKLTAGQYSTAGRGIVATMANDLSAEFAAGETIAMTFMVNLGTTAKNGVGRLYFIKDTTQMGEKADGAYRNVAAVLTTDDSVFYRDADNSIDPISAKVTADEWHKVTFVVSEGKYRVYIDDDYDEASISAEYIATGANATSMTALPMLALTSAASTGSPTYASVAIDNMLTYSGVVDNPKHLLPTTGEAPTPAPTEVPLPKVEMTLTDNVVSMTSDIDGTAYLVQASYDTADTLVAVKTAKEVTLTAATAVTETLELTKGDKIMLWNNLKDITPIADAIVVETGAEQATPAPTAEPTTAPTAEPTATPGAGDATAEPTATPGAGDATTAPTAGPTATPGAGDATTAPTAEPTTAPTAEPTTAPTAAPTYTVAGTVGEGVASVTLKSDANTYTGTIADGAVTFTGVLAGEYTVEVTAAAGYKKATADKTTVTVADANVDAAFAASATARSQQPYAEGTKTNDEEGAVASFVDYSRTTTSIVASTAGTNATKVEKIQTGTGGNSGAGYNIYDAAYPAKGDAVKVSFDMNIPTRNSWVSVRGTKPGTGDRNNDAANRIFTVGAEGSYELKIWNGGSTVTVSGTDLNAKWYHIDAVVNNTAKTVDIKVYDYQATNDYEDLKALYEGTVPFRDNTVAGVAAMDYFSGVNNANMQLDNIYVNDETYVAPVAVTVTAPAATDGTLAADKTVAQTGETVTITATPAAGKKVTGVTVTTATGEVEVTEAEGKYTFTMPAEPVTIAATYGRADIATIEVTGATTASTSTTSQYTAVAKAADGTALEATIAWSVEGASTSTIDAATGLLTVSADETVAPATKEITVKASSEGVDGTLAVTIVNVPSYSVAAATELTGGSVSTDVNTAIEGAKVTVTPVAETGYAISKVTYQNVPAAPTAVTLKYTAEQATNGNNGANTAVYKFVEGFNDAAALALFADAEDATTVDPDLISHSKNYIGGTSSSTTHPAVNVTAPAGTYKIYYLGFNHGDNITATIGEQTVTFGAGVNIAYQEDSTSRVLKYYTADLTLTEAVENAALTFDSTAEYLPDMYAIVVSGTSAATTPTVTEVTATDGVYSFDMPAYDVVVSAEFAKIDYTITKAATENGSFEVAEKAQYGDEVTVTATPAEGYEVASITYTVEGSEEAVKVSGGKFTMPAANVTVTATFKAIEKLAYVSVNSADPNATITDAISTNYMKISGGKLASPSGSGAVIRANITVEGKDKHLKSAVLSFKATCADAGKNSQVAIARVDNVSDVSTATWNIISAQPATKLQDIAYGNDAGVDMSVDITADLLAQGGAATYVLFTNTARAQNITNIALTTVYGTPVTFSTGDVTEGTFEVKVKGVTDTTFAETVTVTNGTASTILVPGEYTYELAEQNGYLAVAATPFTVTEEASSVAITLEENQAAPASLAISYRTDAADAATEIKKVEYALDEAQQFEGQEITVGDTVKATQLVAVGETSKVKAYTYVSGIPAEAITLVAGENVLPIAVAAVEGEFDYYEDFTLYNASSSLNAWNNAGGNYRNSKFEVEDGNTFIRGNATNKQVGQAIYNLATPVTLTGNKVTVEFDFRVPTHTSPCTGEVTIGSSDGNVAMAVAQNTSNWEMGYYTGGAFSTGVGDPDWGMNGNAAAFASAPVSVKAGSYAGTGWYTVKMVFEGGKASVTVTDKANATDTTTVSDIAVTSTDISRIKLGVGKVLGGGNGGGQSYNSGDIDNIKISSEAVAATE